MGGFAKSSSVGASSMMWPIYMTEILSAMWRTTERSWATKRYERENAGLEVFEEVDDLGLYGDVEGGYGFVAYEE